MDQLFSFHQHLEGVALAPLDGKGDGRTWLRQSPELLELTALQGPAPSSHRSCWRRPLWPWPAILLVPSGGLKAMGQGSGQDGLAPQSSGPANSLEPELHLAEPQILT